MRLRAEIHYRPHDMLGENPFPIVVISGYEKSSDIEKEKEIVSLVAKLVNQALEEYEG
jgi:hypothetical protein